MKVIDLVMVGRLIELMKQWMKLINPVMVLSSPWASAQQWLQLEVLSVIFKGDRTNSIMWGHPLQLPQVTPFLSFSPLSGHLELLELVLCSL
jgi:hypothetical protein